MKTHQQFCDLLAKTGDMLDFGRAINICHYAMDCGSVPGDIVEFGCYLGNTAKLLTAISNKPVWVYDSFDGLPEQSPQDKGCAMGRGCLKVSPQDLEANFKADGLRLPNIMQSWFRDVQSEHMPEQIAFAHIDGDFFESILAALRLVWPRLHYNGVIIVDDYMDPRFPGVEKAIIEFSLSLPRVLVGRTKGFDGQFSTQALVREA